MRRLTLLSLCALAVCGQSRLVVRTSTLHDGLGGVDSNREIVIEGGRIAAVRQAGGGPVSHDLKGLTVMPGWIDTHVHLTWHFDDRGRLADNEHESPEVTLLHAKKNAKVMLEAGFTTVQSLGDPLDLKLRGQGDLPRILTSAGSLDERSGTPERIRERVRQFKAAGADVIKIFATASIRDGGRQTMTDEQVAAACGEARAQGLRAVVHAHAPGGAMAAVKAGCTTIEHGALLDASTLAAIAKAGLLFDPNILVFHNYLDNKEKYLGIGNYTEAGFASMVKALTLQRELMQMALAAEVKIIFGTDAVAGAHGRNAEEFIYRVRDAGQPAMDALVAAQSRAAESLGLGDRIGRIAPGFEADLIALDGDPLRDITTVRRVVFVMRGGRILRSDYKR